MPHRVRVGIIRRQLLLQNYVQARGRLYVRKAQNAQTIKLENQQINEIIQKGEYVRL